MDHAFDRLISPISPDIFFSQFWGREYVIADGKPDRFRSLFSWDALSEVLSTHRFEFPRLRLLSGGRVAPPDQYIVRKVDRRGNAYTTHDAEAVKRMLLDGAMLHITSIGETWRPLSEFATELELAIGGRVQVNLHAGFAGSRGFHTHWDGHDVYATQIDGCKRWRLFGFTEEAPLAVPPDEKHGAPADHSWEGVLGVGQMLYLPRGYWHATQFLDEPSLHLTFAVQHPTALDYARWLVEQLGEDGFGRRDMPLAAFEMAGEESQLKDEYLDRLRDLVVRRMSSESLARFVADYRATLGRANHVQLEPAERVSNASSRL